MPPWERWRRLRAPEKRLRVSALCAVAGARLALTILPFARLRASSSRIATAGPRRPTRAGPTPPEVDRAVSSAARFVPGATCLVRALAAQWILHRSGRRAALRIGVAQHANGTVDAHAWVECDDGSLVGERGRTDYAEVSL